MRIMFDFFYSHVSFLDNLQLCRSECFLRSGLLLFIQCFHHNIAMLLIFLNVSFFDHDSVTIFCMKFCSSKILSINAIIYVKRKPTVTLLCVDGYISTSLMMPGTSLIVKGVSLLLVIHL